MIKYFDVKIYHKDTKRIYKEFNCVDEYTMGSILHWYQDMSVNSCKYDVEYKEVERYDLKVEFRGDFYKVRIKDFHYQPPYSGSPYDCDSDWDYYGYSEVEYQWAEQPPEDWDDITQEMFYNAVVEAAVKEFKDRDYD